MSGRPKRCRGAATSQSNSEYVVTNPPNETPEPQNGAAPANGKRSLKGVSQRVLREVSELIVEGAHQVAQESDTWFLTALGGLNKGARHTQAAASRFGRYVLVETNKLRPSWLKQKTQRERIRSMLLREAKRAKLSGREFEAFSEQIAVLVELVLQGTVKVSDIAFEHDDRLRE